MVNGSSLPSEFFGRLDACLKSHGIAHPERSARAADVERTIPALLGTAGIPVPDGSTKAQYEVALRACGVENVQVGRVPITSSILKQRIVSVRLCLSNNGFRLPAPNFAGPGPVLDTTGVDIGSARWVATAMGCSVTRSLTPTALRVCVHSHVLAGRATGVSFENDLLALPRCLKRAGV